MNTMPVVQKAISWKRISSPPLGGDVYVDARLSMDSYIYHRLEYPYARAIFETDRLRLGRVASWQDPYEKWWCETLFARAGSLANTRSYALCWTSSWNDEPAWRMVGFGKQHPIVRIRIRVSELLNAVAQFAAGHHGAMFLGKVLYRTEGALKAAADEVRMGRIDDVLRTAATMLLHKRNAFRFEEEIRLLWMGAGADDPEQWLPIHASESITQVLISPHVPDEQQEAIRGALGAFGVDVLSSRVLHAPR